MCLAIPAQVVSIEGDMATVEIGGVQREASLALVDADIGDYVILHVGIAIAKLDEAEAAERLKLFDEIGELDS